MVFKPQMRLVSRAGLGRKAPCTLRRCPFCILSVILLMFSQFAVPSIAAGQEESAGEYEIKAAMLYNLMQFVEWPSSAYTDASSPSVLCVLGWDPFGKSLASLVSGKILDGRRVEIRHVDGGQTRACHVLYISSSERKHLAQILSNLSGATVLTVGEMSHFAERGGMIQFALEEKQVHFDINADAASRSGLKISARLLALARIVKYSNGNSSLESPARALDAWNDQLSFFAICRWRELVGAVDEKNHRSA